MIERTHADRLALWLLMGMGASIAILIAWQPAPQLVVTVIAAGIIFLAVLDRRTALYLIPPVMALSPDIPALGVPVRIEDFIMVPLAVGWLIRIAVLRERRGTPLDRILFAYVLVGFIATAVGGVLGTAHITLTDKYLSAPFHMLKRVEFVFLFLILADTLATVTDVARFTYVLMASLAMMNLLGLSAYMANQYIALGPTGAPVHEPGLVAMLNALFALSLLPVARGLGKWLLLGLLFFSVLVLPLGLGRNFVASTILVLIYAAISQRQLWVLAILPLSAAVASLVYPEHIIRRLLTLKFVFAYDVAGAENQGAALVSRLAGPAYYMLYTLGHSPFLGLGLAAVALGSIDNEYIVQLFYTGLVGFAIFLTFGVKLFRMAREAQRAATDLLQTSLARGYHLALVGYAILSIFSPSISATRGGGFFFIFIGLLAVLHRALTQPSAAGHASSG